MHSNHYPEAYENLIMIPYTIRYPQAHSFFPNDQGKLLHGVSHGWLPICGNYFIPGKRQLPHYRFRIVYASMGKRVNKHGNK